jgi:hypothetical protein
VGDKGKRPCAGCAKTLDDGEGIELWGSRFCSTCFISNAGKFHRELKPEDIALLKVIGRETAGYLPPELLEMVLIGFYKRASGQKDPPPTDELARCVGEIQRLAAFSNFGKVLNLLKTWQGTFNEFVESQEADIRDAIKRLTDFE